MENYVLQSNESVLYKGEGYFAKKSDSLFSNSKVEIILTNLNLVFIEKTKRIFSKEEVSVERYPVEDIKLYEHKPQIKQKNNLVEIYLKNGEKTINFISRHEVYKFINAVNKLLTGKSMAVRGADKVKNAVNLVDDTLGVNTIDAVKNVVENGVVGAVFNGLGRHRHPQKKSTLERVINVAKESYEGTNSTTNNHVQETTSLDQQIEMVKKLKDLFDAGIITQEEFDAKKKQIMGL